MDKKKLSLLIIDDSQTVRDVMSAELQALGYTVYLAKSAEAALEILKKQDVHIDLVFLDLQLPGMHGLEFLQKVQETKNHLIIIVMTAYESTETAVKSIENGAYDYVIKPIEPHHLELLIYRALKRYEIEQQKNKLFESKQNEKELIAKLKKEVNGLLKELGKDEKY